ncbi:MULTISPECIES: trypsin-like peptidase domain-containing protein [Paenibacillus]|uniref:S1C family serine protease n=1 Tax=Paenibacillus TaxID=44249 RepID=UPI00096D7DDB|nr:trypsin-like peptidase domain-containing protein [Paenibacillus odorifer]OME23903.1 serine protease [Paenibacillus odorifer]OME33545.1 serine protease [Paenibacillus odorifer]OME39666.1 serine protease [Paenibacillus odorifer]OME40942.1 serine protease [Paenibacillus odorifer]OME47486.1 serine protease [Paenibacillus odorifer]
MDDNKNNFNRDNGPAPDREWDNNNNSSNNNTSSETGSSSYYYSYGPFKSLNKDENNADGGAQHYNRMEPERVEVTPPQPVKPLPYNTSLRTTGYDGNGGGRGGNGGGGSEGGGGWQYNKKPKSSLKTVLVSFLAGMVVLSGSMYMADRGNWFTGDTATTVATSSGTNGTAKTTGESAGVAPSTSTTSLVTGSRDVTGVVDAVGPAVVKIETLVKTNSRNGSSSSPNLSDPFSQFFFGDQYSGNGSSQNEQDSKSGSDSSSQLIPYGIGTGFIYEKSGYILTNQHVIDNADVIQVTVDGVTKPYEAKLLGSSKDLDLAVLKIEGDSDFPTVALGDSDSIKVGSEVVAIGNPQGFDHTVTSGVLSAKGRSIDINEEDGSGTRNYKNLLQTDASINPGNSGGPLLNMNGQVIGMNVAVSTDSQGIGFAIAVNTIKEVVDKLEANQAIPKEPVPFIGATLMTITDEVAKQMGTDIKEGSVVADIIYKSPAYTADLRPYDIITGANGTKYATNQDLITFIQTLKVGDKVTLNVVRDGKTMDLSVTIGNKNDFDTTTTQQSQQQ